MERLEHGHAPKEIAARLQNGPRISYLRDWVYGGIDGSITTFAIVTGAAGAHLSVRVILLLGVAKLLADALSMASANFTGTQSEIEEYRHVRHMEERHVALHPEGEREEIRQIFRAKGFEGADLERVVEVITEEHERWIETMMAEEHGLPVVKRSPIKAALYTFAAFVLCGLVPLLPFMFGFAVGGVWLALIMTGVVFFGIGSLRSRWSPKLWWRAGIETLVIGLGTAGVAYLVGDFLKTFF